MSSLYSYLPPHDGLLPKWLLLVAAIAVGNSIQAYMTMAYTYRVYSGTSDETVNKRPATKLSARTWGTWTFLAALIRFYAAYHIDEPAWYQLVLWTYGVAFGHFMSEWLVFKSAKMGEGLASPLIVSGVTLPWMFLQWGYYVK